MINSEIEEEEEEEEVKLRINLPAHPTHIFNPGDQLQGQVQLETAKVILVERKSYLWIIYY